MTSPIVPATSESHAANLARFSGLAATYDDFRPRPPAALADFLLQIAGSARCVADLGSGTGLSTRLWAGRAARIVGVEPNADMRRVAAERFPEAEFRDGHGAATSLDDASADIVTAAQCLHWMEPAPTFAEIARILRPGGVFAAYDYDWPPAVHPRAEAALMEFLDRCAALEIERGRPLRDWEKSGHLGRMRASGQFSYVREVLLHSVEPGSAARLVGLALSSGGVGALLGQGMSEEELGLPQLREVAREVLGEGEAPWWFSYRVRLGVK